MSAGRPRKFDEQVVLDTAMRRFWREGYAHTRLDDIAREAGVTKPSLYLAFGDKDTLFSMALELYGRLFGARVKAAFDDTETLAGAFAAYFGEVASILTDAGNPRGCLRVCTIGELTGVNADLTGAARAQRKATRTYLAKRGETELGDRRVAQQLAEMAVTISDGMAMAARSGSSRRQISETAVNAASALASLCSESD